MIAWHTWDNSFLIQEISHDSMLHGRRFHGEGSTMPEREINPSVSNNFEAHTQLWPLLRNQCHFGYSKMHRECLFVQGSWWKYHSWYPRDTGHLHFIGSLTHARSPSTGVLQFEFNQISKSFKIPDHSFYDSLWPDCLSDRFFSWRASPSCRLRGGSSGQEPPLYAERSRGTAP